jgi:hypothetical protein
MKNEIVNARAAPKRLALQQRFILHVAFFITASNPVL